MYIKRFVISLLCLQAVASGQQTSPATAHRKAIIVLTYDDALASQLQVAVPQLDSAHLTATFFLDGNVNTQNIAGWGSVAKKGYELANHTLYHPCRINGPDSNSTKNSNHYTVASIISEIDTMNARLFAIDHHSTTRTYAYPCTEGSVGGHSYVDTLKRSGLVQYARMGGDASAIVTDYKNLDAFLVPSWAVTGNPDGSVLIDFVKKVQGKKGLGVFMFHGIGGDYITTSAAAHRQLLSYLSQHRDEIDVLTFRQAMDMITKYR